MALNVETGLGGADSECYASVAQADVYLSNRGMENWALLPNEKKEQALRRGCDYIGLLYGQKFAGTRVSETQVLDFPRYEVPNYMGSYHPSDSVPRGVAFANIEAAIRAAAGELIEDQDAPVVEETVGPITTRFAAGVSQAKKFPVIDKLLATFLSGGGNSIRLIRA